MLRYPAPPRMVAERGAGWKENGNPKGMEILAVDAPGPEADVSNEERPESLQRV